MLRPVILSILLFLPWSAIAKIERVIYITLDGVMWQDIYQQTDFAKNLRQKNLDSLHFYGYPGAKEPMQVASIPVSQPSYSSQMAGQVLPCYNNDCPRIDVQTFPEEIIARTELSSKAVAVFASWPVIGLTTEHLPGTISNNNGNVPMVDSDTQQADAVMHVLNELQDIDHPDGGDRYDKYTTLQAMHYLETYQPRFLWLSLGDADDQAHANQRQQYLNTLAYYEIAIDRLLQMLSRKNWDKSTAIIITTDHGRGDGDDWSAHGPAYPESSKTWAITINTELVPEKVEQGIAHYSTLSIKPTVLQYF